MSSFTTVTHQEKFDTDHIVNVANLKSADSVLLIGNDQNLLSLFKSFCGSYKNIKKEKELNSLLLNGNTFDKVFVTSDNILEPVFLQKVFQLVTSNSLVIFMYQNEKPQMVVDYIEENFQQANVWEFNSSCGYVLVTDAYGVSPQMN